jgi:16S rRNA (cytosine1407-C5)-methyltransferase
LRYLPEKFLERLAKIVPPNKLDEVERSFNRKKPTTFRVNTLKAQAPQVLENLKEAGFQLGRVPWLKEAFILKGGRQKDLEETPEYKEGHIYLQNLSSMVPPLVLGPLPKEKVLDLAAAPGGKTAQMAARMKGEGWILAVDDNEVRLEKLKANLSRQGAVNVECLLANGAVVGNHRPGVFDRVLLDAPCSSEGRFFMQDARTFSYWKEEKVRKNAREQKRLMLSALRALRAGGVLVYSTCTFAPEENEGVLAWALERFGDAVELQPVSLPFSNVLQGLTSWEGRTYGESMRKARRILPTGEMEGFFVARILKKRDLPPQRQAARMAPDKASPTMR